MPGKRKGRPKTVGDSSTSPEDKKSKQAFGEEYSNNEDDEVLKALSVAADLGKKLDEVLERLSKLDVIESRLNNLYTTMANIEGAISSLDKDVLSWKLNRIGEQTGTKCRVQCQRYRRLETRPAGAQICERGPEETASVL